MANVSLNIILGAVNKAMPGLQAVEGKLRDLKAGSEEFRASWSESLAKAQGAGAALMGTSVGLGLVGKSATDASMQMEGYSAQLRTALKDNDKAREMMQWAKDFSYSTPFQLGDIVGGAAKLELYGMSAKKWLPLVGDMAGAMGKDVGDAVEAVADAQNGELERLKEFGINSAKLLAAGANQSSSGGVANTTAEDKAALLRALEKVMVRDYGGGMANMMNTTKGALSNLTSNIFVLRAAIGDALAPSLKQIVGWLTWTSQWVTKLSTDHPTLTRAVVMTGVGFALLAGTLGPLLYFLPGIVDGWNMLRNAQLLARASAIVTRIPTLAAGIAARVSGLYATVAAGGFRALAAGLWESLAAAAPVAIAIASVVAIILAAIGAATNMAKVFKALKEGRWQDALKLEANNISPAVAVKNGFEEVKKRMGAAKEQFSGMFTPEGAKPGADAAKAASALKPEEIAAQLKQVDADAAKLQTQAAADTTDAADALKAAAGDLSAGAVEDKPAMQKAVADALAAAQGGSDKATSAGQQVADALAAAQTPQVTVNAQVTQAAPETTPLGGSVTATLAESVSRLLWQKRTDRQGNVEWTALKEQNGLMQGQGTVNYSPQYQITVNGGDPAATRQAVRQAGQDTQAAFAREFRRNMGYNGLQPAAQG